MRSMDRGSYGRYAAGDYLEYQKRYAASLRESDRVLIDQVARVVAERPGEDLTLVDIGCSTGNLLRHIGGRIPGLRLVGGDVYPAVIEGCREDESLGGISFEVMDILALDRDHAFDIVIVNAVLYLFGSDDLAKAIANVAAVTKAGGRFITFDLFHGSAQDLEVVERSETHPDGLLLHFRPFSDIRELLESNGFSEVSYEPFRIPIDLARPERPADISSHTVRTKGGERLIFRGALFTPWCHLTAVKAG